MRVQKITSAEQNHSAIHSNNIGKNHYKNNFDTVSFKSYGVCKIISLVGLYGYKVLKTDVPKADFKDAVIKRINSPNAQNGARELVDTLFALAKTAGRDEPKTNAYRLCDKNEYTSMQDLRDLAIKKLFPLIPEMANDANSGHSAKVAMLNSMIDTGEYIDSMHFFKAFEELPPMYDAEKIAMTQKALKNKNVISKIHQEIGMDKAEQIAKDQAKSEYKEFLDNPIAVLLTPFLAVPIDGIKYSIWVKNRAKKIFAENIGKVEDKRSAANTAMILSLDPVKFKSFYSDYNATIKEQAQRAFKYIAELLKKDRNGYSKNNLYKSYSGNFYKNNDYDVFSGGEQIIAKQYYSDFMNAYINDKDRIMQEFNIDDKHYEDMLKDYILLQKAKHVSDKKALTELFQKRIEEKLADNENDIKESASALLDMTGKTEEELKSLREIIKASKPKPEVKPETSCGYSDDNYSDLESWEAADLSTPWIVR